LYEILTSKISKKEEVLRKTNLTQNDVFFGVQFERAKQVKKVTLKMTLKLALTTVVLSSSIREILMS